MTATPAQPESSDLARPPAAPAEPPVTPPRRDLGTRPDAVDEAPPPGSDFTRAAWEYRNRAPLSSDVARPPRPGTVTAAAVLMFISGGLGLLAGGALYLLAGQLTVTGEERSDVLLITGTIAVLSVLNVILGFFILRGRQWARITTIVIASAGIVLGLVEVAMVALGGESSGSCCGLILNGVVIGLLLSGTAGDYFRMARF